MTVPPSADERVVRGACPHDCPDGCAWLVTVRDGVAVKLAGDPDHPITRGGLCAKVNPYLERVYSPDRVLHPLRRVGPKGSGRFERVSWDAALDGIAARLTEVVERHGPTAVLPYSYLGTMGFVQGSSLDRRFFARLGATRLVREICAGTGGAGVASVLGTATGMLPEDVAASRLVVIWGANPVVTNLHLWPLVRQAREQGAQVVVIDPARTRTAAAADWHVRPRPGSDGALALGMMRLIVDEGLHDADYVARHADGFDALRRRLADWPLARAAAETGLAEEEIARLARAYATTKPAAIRLLVGMEHRANGAAVYAAVAMLPALVGAWRQHGGGVAFLTFGLAATALNSGGVMMPEVEDLAIREVNMVQIGRALTDPAMDPPIAALVVYDSNPAVIAPNQRLVLEGLRREDLFTVVHEQFLTDTARHADYVLPATTQVEHLDLLASWGHTCVALNRPAIAPLGEAVPNTEFFRRLAARLGFDEPWLHESDEAIVRTALRSDHPWLAGITWESLCETGWAPLAIPRPWLPFADGGFPTASGRCDLDSPLLAGLDAPNPAAGDLPLSLLTPRSAVHFLNSGYANLPRHRKAEGEPRLDIHPDDAAARGIEDGAPVRVFNERGALHLPARVSDRMPPGVVAVPHGWWACQSADGLSANALTPDGLSDAGGGGDFADARVEVALAVDPERDGGRREVVTAETAD